MSVDQSLRRRAGEPKHELIAYADQRRFRKEMDRVLEGAFALGPPRDEGHVVNEIDHFALEHPLPDGRTVLERFVAERRDLSDADRVLLLRWRDVVEGIFEIERRDGETLIAHNLIDELTYRITSTAGPAWMDGLRRGMFLNTRIVPLGDEWMLSGASSFLDEEQREGAEETAAGLAFGRPELVFRNPAKLAEGWRRQRRSRDHFIRFFGSDLVIIPGAELKERMRAYRHDALYVLRDEKGETAAQRIRDGFGEYPPDDPRLDETLFTAGTVGVFYDEDGLYYLPEYGLVADSFAHPALAGEKHHRMAVKDCIEDPDVPPAAIRRLAEAHEEAADQVIRTIIKRPDFSWPRDGEALLRRHKREYYDDPPRPGVAPLSERLEKARVRLLRRFTEGLKERVEAMTASPSSEATLIIPKSGRNDPCPCGSSKKYKRCHGA